MNVYHFILACLYLLHPCFSIFLCVLLKHIGDIILFNQVGGFRL